VDSPHIHVPFDLINNHAAFLKEHKLNLEIFFSAGTLDNTRPPDIANAIDSLGYDPMVTMHAPFMDLSPGAVDLKVRGITRERFSQVFDIADVLKPRAIVFHSGYEKWKYDHRIDVWLEGSLNLWPEFVKRASEIGTVIAVENIFEDSPDSLAALMEGLGSKHAGICLDVGHFNIFSKSPLDHWLESLGDYLVELHLHDNDRGYDSHMAIGEGSFDFDALFAALKGSNIIHTVEAHSPEGVMNSLEALRQYAL
jgi:sugar phosphate isomerase/epimerase